ncbi:MAG: electron transport protein HydN [Rouxiella aceris]|jgi:electron transport protein HydN|uniref:Electron transport protein HydN n=1 Tax=Rouxiella aceris TaxID=2703884 RepID=A0A848MKN5_9GAMM|nr:electron transport protein HydN [Rouxiella aceris]MDR3431659.1 electron transport protein HydN [Rouxiella aceris]NMP28907.1 electron transport protein HydN [Rouxiella aceris]
MNKFIIADPKKCIGCRTCEIACVMAHAESQEIATFTAANFVPRLHVIRGMNLTTPVLCRQCEDAPCANVCPNGAISRLDDRVQVLQERCIGCKTCVVACPYGAMEVVTKPVFRQNGAMLKTTSEKAEAHKCDLCSERENGPACMEVCPTNALHCVDREMLQEMSAEKRRRAALDNTSPLLF